MTTATPDGSRTFKPDPDCEAFAFNHPGVMATSRAELIHMLSTTSLDEKTARPAGSLMGMDLFLAERARFVAWMAGIEASNKARLPQPPRKRHLPAGPRR